MPSVCASSSTWTSLKPSASGSQDNLSTHTRGSLYETFPAAEAHRILGRLEFHYTPKHASWLNMVEIEIGVLKGQCLDRRIDNRAELEREIAAWERERNAVGARVTWMFTTEKARTKMGRAYPKPTAALDQPINSHNHCGKELARISQSRPRERW